MYYIGYERDGQPAREVEKKLLTFAHVLKHTSYNKYDFKDMVRYCLTFQKDLIRLKIYELYVFRRSFSKTEETYIKMSEWFLSNFVELYQKYPEDHKKVTYLMCLLLKEELKKICNIPEFDTESEILMDTLHICNRKLGELMNMLKPRHEPKEYVTGEEDIY